MVRSKSWSPANKSSLIQISEVGDDSDRAIKARLAQAVVRAHVWLRLLLDGSVSQHRRPARAAGLASKSDPQQNKVGVSGARYNGRTADETHRPAVQPNTVQTEAERAELLAASRATGRNLIVIDVSGDQAIETAFNTLVEQGAGGLLVGSGPFMNSHRQKLPLPHAILSRRFTPRAKRLSRAG